MIGEQLVDEPVDVVVEPESCQEDGTETHTCAQHVCNQCDRPETVTAVLHEISLSFLADVKGLACRCSNGKAAQL